MFEIALLIGIYVFGLGSGLAIARKTYTGRYLGPVPAAKPEADASPPASPK